MAIAPHARIRNRLGTLVIAAIAWTGIGAAPAAPAPPAPPDASSGSAWLGIFLGDALDGGVQIVAVLPGGPGDRAGLRQGDVVLAIGDRETSNRLVLGEAVDAFRAGDVVPVRVLREGTVTEVRVDSGASPASFAWGSPPRARSGELPEPPGSWFEFSRGSTALGVEVREISEELRTHFGAPAESGVLVAAVAPDSPAAAAGVRVGDVLVRAAGRPVTRSIDLMVAARRERAGRTLPLEIVRARKPVAVTLTIPPVAGGGERRERDDEILRLREEVESLRRALEEERSKTRRDGS